MASVTAPRKAAPTRVRTTASTSLPPAARPAATSPTAPIAGDEVEHRGELGGTSRSEHVRSRSCARPARGGRAPRPLPATPARRRTIDTTRGAPRRWRRRAAPRLGRRPGRRLPGRHGACGHHEIDRPQQPAVADADLAPAGRDPQEQQAAGRPLQQDGGGVELIIPSFPTGAERSGGSPTARSRVDLERHAADETGRLGAEEGDDPAEVGRVAGSSAAETTELLHPVGGVDPGARQVEGDAVGKEVGRRRLGPRPEAGRRCSTTRAWGWAA